MPASVPTAFPYAQVVARYAFPRTTGKGQTIGIIELGGGYREADFKAFCEQHGLPADPPVDVSVGGHGAGNNFGDPAEIARLATAADAPDANIGELSSDPAWPTFLGAVEVTADLQIARAFAPDAALRVYFAPHGGFAIAASGLARAIDAAVKDRVTVISVSWGAGEPDWCMDPDGAGPDPRLEKIEAALLRARQAGIPVCCSAGDYGTRTKLDDNGPISARVSYPASSPNVLAVGGSALQFDGATITGEVVWNSPPLATGGGMSGYFPRPDYQTGLATPAGAPGLWVRGGQPGFNGRWVPDVVAHVDRAHGYPVVLAGREFRAEGTSAAAPLWAALLARVGESLGKPVGWFNDRLYAAAAAGRLHGGSGQPGFIDIVSGGNALPDVARSFTAGTGWDACTGFGAPNGVVMLDLLRTP